MIVIARESVDECYEDMSALRETLYNDYSPTAVFEKCDPDEAIYRAMDEAGMLASYIVRRDGEMIGFGVYFVRPHHHTRGIWWAVCDVFYVDPDRKNRGLGRKLLEYIEKDLRNCGVTWMYTAHCLKGRALGVLLTSLGHVRSEIGHLKRLV